MRRVNPKPVQTAEQVHEAGRARRTLNPEQFGFVRREEMPMSGDLAPAGSRMMHPDEALHTTQQGLSGEDVQRYVAQPKAVPFNPLSRRPRIIEHEGELWIHDGHHRIAAARSQGRPIRVDVVKPT